MEFKAKFMAPGTSSIRSAVSKPSVQVGSLVVHAIRGHFSEPVPLERIAPSIEHLNRDIDITVPEQIAFETPLFREKNTVRVYGPNRFLNRFVSIQFRKNHDGTFCAYYDLDADAVIEAWRDAGFPEKIEEKL